MYYSYGSIIVVIKGNDCDMYHKLQKDVEKFLKIKINLRKVAFNE